MLPEDEEAAGSHAASPLPSPATAAGMTDSPAPSPPSVITDAEDPGVDAEDPELRDGPKLDLHSLRARDAALDALAAEVQLTAAKYAADGFRDFPAELASMRDLCGTRNILITGSAGYLGATLHVTLRELGMKVVGVDIVPSPTTDVVLDLADRHALMSACDTGDCCAVLHTAALHAPHSAAWHAKDFYSTNVIGTENVLALNLPTVHTSTTSLMITKRVKEREAAGQLVWLDERSQRPDLATAAAAAATPVDPMGLPRNKYGRTKLAAEQACLAAASHRPASAAVCVLRAPRFFPEDGLEGHGGAALSPPNLKVNELLGRRVSLTDLVDAHLRTLARIQRLQGKVLTLAAPWPADMVPTLRPSGNEASSSGSPQAAAASGTAAFTAASGTAASQAALELRRRFPLAEALFATHGWRLPKAVTRTYDSSAAMEALDWAPRVTFEAVLDALGALHAHGGAEPSSPGGEAKEKAKRDAKEKEKGSGVTFADVLHTMPFLFRFITLLWTRVRIEGDQAAERLKEAESKRPQAAGGAAGPRTDEGAAPGAEAAAAAAAPPPPPDAAAVAAAASALTFTKAPNDAANLLRGAF
jgi:UDP-glucose 4-epimerase